MRRAPLFLTALTALGCGSTTNTPPSEPTTVEPATVQPAPVAPSQNQPSPQVAAPPLEVHEWGLIDVYSDGQIELAAGPGSASSRPTPTPAYRPPMPMRKPVVYFHLDPAVDHLDVNVDVHIAGTMLETWPSPTTQTALDHIAWQGTVTHCAPGSHSAATDPAVQAGVRGCATSDGVCEVADLPTYETRDGDCVSVGAQEGRLLFYRGELAHGTRFPLTITGTDVSVTSALPHRVYFFREGVGFVIQTNAGTVTPLPLGPDTGASATSSFIAPFNADLQAAGLTEDEARAFMAAWGDAIFGGEASTRRGPSRDARATTPPEGILLYFLPRADIERLAPMQVTPTPRHLERVMVVRHHVAI